MKVKIRRYHKTSVKFPRYLCNNKVFWIVPEKANKHGIFTEEEADEFISTQQKFIDNGYTYTKHEVA